MGYVQIVCGGVSHWDANVGSCVQQIDTNAIKFAVFLKCAQNPGWSVVDMPVGSTHHKS